MKTRLVLLVVSGLLVLATGLLSAAEPVRYCRFQKGNTVAYGILEGQQVRQLNGDLFGTWSKSESVFPLKSIKLLVPSQPTHVFAMAGNYKSHLGDGTTTRIITKVTTIKTDPKTGKSTTDEQTTEELRVSGKVPEKFQIPQPFFKSRSSLIADDETVLLPRNAGAVHYEAEMVVVIGRQARDVSPAQALDFVLGVTCGNDISAREWQKDDVQWWRAKACDSFGPCGPFIVSGVNYDDLQLTLRLNGEVRQQERTSQLIHNVADTVSFISRHVTLEPGDLIFTGTPGTTAPIKPGDVMQVELEGAGVLRNPVRAR